MTIEYRPTEVFADYRVGSDGTVWSKRKPNGHASETWRELTPTINKKGYRCVVLYRDKRRFHFRIAHLVLFTFIGQRPTPQHQCCHGDGNSKNDRLTNLRWGTASENQQDAIRHGTQGMFGENNCHAILRREQVLLIRQELEQGKSSRELGERYGVHATTINSIRSRKSWRWL